MTLVNEPEPLTSAPAPKAALPELIVTRTSTPSMKSEPPSRVVMTEVGPEPCKVRVPLFIVPTETL